MKAWFLLTLLALFPAQNASVAITSPQPGQVVQGVITITGTSDAPAFSYAEIAFAYTADPTATWFLIASADQPVSEGTLASWDTTSLTDGDYDLRLRVYLQDGTYLENIVPALHVRNDILTPTATFTPAPTPTEKLPLLISPSPRPRTGGLATVPPAFPTPLPLPTNPAVLPSTRLSAAFGQGALLSFALILLFALLLRLRRP
jgi:hypothetical protein